MAIKQNQVTGAHLFPDAGRVPLQVARWSGSRVSTATSGTSARVTIPSGATLIEISSTEAVYINFGDVTVTASSTIASDGSRLFMAGVQVIPVPLDPATGSPYTHVAAIQVSTAGIFQVEELE